MFFNKITKTDSPETDEAIMASFAKNGNDKDLEILIARYYVAALSLAESKLFERKLAEDAVQLTFIKITQKRCHFNSNHTFSSWFFTILKNTCIDIIRKREREKKKISEFTELTPQNSGPNQNSIHEILRQLPEEDRELLIYRFVQDLSFKNIAEITGKSLEALKKRSQRAIKKLKALMSLF